MRRIVGFGVTGLLGRFDHHVDFPPDWNYVILHGPNGVGKTRFLELLTAVVRLDVESLGLMNFQSAQVSFDDGARLDVTRSTDGPPDRSRPARYPRSRPRSIPTRPRSIPTIELRMFRGAQAEVRWKGDGVPNDYPGFRQMLEDLAPIRQVGNSRFRDMLEGDLISLAEALSRYGETIGIDDPGRRNPIPPMIRDYSDQIPVHLIETQRLLTVESLERPRGIEKTHRPTVVEYASDLQNRLQEALASNSRIAQSLDRSFPGRVLSATTPPGVNDATISRKHAEQNDLRGRLAQVGLLEDVADVALPERDLAPWQTAFLWTYLGDVDQKLRTFEPLLDRLDVLRDIVGSRFLYKRLEIDATYGFKIESDRGDRIPAEALSSGEQHELILFYDLLFKARPGSVVLIDEPEISLHVAWQQRFLRDLERIAEIASLRFIIATHSPQIIHKSWSRTVRLAPHLGDGQ